MVQTPSHNIIINKLIHFQIILPYHFFLINKSVISLMTQKSLKCIWSCILNRLNQNMLTSLGLDSCWRNTFSETLNLSKKGQHKAFLGIQHQPLYVSCGRWKWYGSVMLLAKLQSYNLMAAKFKLFRTNETGGIVRFSLYRALFSNST